MVATSNPQLNSHIKLSAFSHQKLRVKYKFSDERVTVLSEFPINMKLEQLFRLSNLLRNLLIHPRDPNIMLMGYAPLRVEISYEISFDIPFRRKVLDDIQCQDLGGSSKGRENSSPARCTVSLPSSVVDFPSLVDSILWRLIWFMGIHNFWAPKWLPWWTARLFASGDSFIVRDKIVAKFIAEEGFDQVELKPNLYNEVCTSSQISSHLLSFLFMYQETKLAESV